MQHSAWEAASAAEAAILAPASLVSAPTLERARRDAQTASPEGARDSDPARETESPSYSGEKEEEEAREGDAEVAPETPPPSGRDEEVFGPGVRGMSHATARATASSGSPWPSVYHLSGWHKGSFWATSACQLACPWCFFPRHPAEPGGDAAPAAPPAPEPVAVKVEPEGKEAP